MTDIPALRKDDYGLLIARLRRAADQADRLGLVVLGKLLQMALLEAALSVPAGVEPRFPET